MAKQSGIHQIRGKIGQHSYYRQTGVSSGLIRQINPGLSERVKTAPEYENTRLNNAEFKVATQAAGSLFAGVQPILRPTRTLFRTSRLAAELYKILSRSTVNWGRRVFMSTQRDAICAAMHKFAKRKMSEYAAVSVGAYNASLNEIVVYLKISTDISAYMSAMGADMIQFKVYQMQYYQGQFVAGGDVLVENVTVIQDVTTENYDPTTDDPGTTVPVTAKCMTADLTILSGRNYIPFIVVVALPIRTGDDANQVLQDKCTFTILPDTSFVD